MEGGMGDEGGGGDEDGGGDRGDGSTLMGVLSRVIMRLVYCFEGLHLYGCRATACRGCSAEAFYEPRWLDSLYLFFFQAK